MVCSICIEAKLIFQINYTVHEYNCCEHVLLVDMKLKIQLVLYDAVNRNKVSIY
jgi:hypothetical protein